MLSPLPLYRNTPNSVHCVSISFVRGVAVGAVLDKALLHAMRWSSARYSLLMKAGPVAPTFDLGLSLAVSWDYAELVTVLLEAGAIPLAHGHLEEAERLDSPAIFLQLLVVGTERQVDIDSCLAAKGGNVEVVCSMLEAGANASVNDIYCLKAAAKEGLCEVVSILLAAGVDVNARPYRDRGYDALHHAVNAGNCELT